MTSSEAPSNPSSLGEEGNGAGDRADVAYRRLRHLIVGGQLAPGSRIVETDVADRLDMSRTPVRSALQRLRQEGYVEASERGKRSGSFVAPLTAEDARELLFIMGMLESLAARHCAEAPDVERATVVEELEALNRELRGAAADEGGDRSRILALDREFHWTFVRAGAGSRLRTLHDMVRPQTERYLRFYLDGLADRIDDSIEEHEAIVHALREADAAGAEKAVRTSWRNGAERLTAVIERRGEWGSW